MEFINILINAVLALIMFGIGSSLKFSNFQSTFSNPKALMIGLFLQMIFLPSFAFGIVYISELNPLLKTGLFIVALCPGGATSNFISYLVNANVALSIALTTINSFLILFTIPFFSNLGILYFLGEKTGIELPYSETISQVFLILLLPAVLGVIFNETFPSISKRLQRPLKYLNIILLGIVFAVKIFAGKNQGGSGINKPDILLILPFALIIHLLSMGISYIVGKITLRNINTASTIGIEVGLQNTTLAILVTSVIIGSSEMSKPALVFAMFSFFTTLFFAISVNYLEKRKTTKYNKALNR